MNIPVIVADMIGKLLSEKENENTRNNLRMTLLNIRDEIDKAVTEYDASWATRFDQPKKKKRS